MNGGGFVNQVYRDMLNWQWYRDMPVRVLFEHLLRIVTEDDKMELGLCIKSGSVLTSISKLQQETNLTTKQIRIALSKLISTNDISMFPSRKNGTIISITEWFKYKSDDAYQQNDDNASNIGIGKQRANKGQTEQSDLQQLTNNNETDRANKGQTEAMQEPQIEHKGKQRANKGQTEAIENHDDMNATLSEGANKGQTESNTKEQENETEKKEDTPIPTEEIKEKDKEKESVIQEEKNNIQKEEGQDTPTDEVDEYPFEAFWEAYGRKIDRPKCERKWARLSKEDKRACMEYIPKYVASTPDIQFRRHPTTFLNNRSWENDLPTPPQQLLLFPNQMSYGDRKRMLNGPELGHMPGTGEIINTDEINKEGPF